MGYSLDNSTDTTVVDGTSVGESVSAATGTHTLHVKAWGEQGAACSANVTVAVTDASSPENSLVPSGATTVSSLQTSTGWRAAHDAGTRGSSSGSMSIVGSPSISGHAREFKTSFSGSGGEIYDLTWGRDTSSENFFYDGWVYLSSSASNIANLEMDMNQVIADGDTVIYGFQCDGYSGTWDYTANKGSASKPDDQWVHTGASCKVSNWGKDQWHHVQVSYSRTSDGVVTYNSVWLDGTEQQINATVNSAFALGWGPILLTNFQVDGYGSGSDTVYIDNLTISRW